MTNPLLCIILINLIAFPIVAGSQKPVIEAPIIGEVYDPPTTLEAMLARSDVVVIAVLRAVADVPDRAKRLARTDYQADVLQIVKSDQHLDQKLRVCRPGIGTVEYEDRIVRRFQPGMPELPSGRQFLFFLSWDEGTACYQLAFGPASIAGFNESGKVAHFVSNPALRELNRLEIRDVVKKLEAARKNLKYRR